MSNPSILVVEDDGILALMLQGMLEGRGYTVLGPLASAEEALALLARRQADLVLLDIELAGRMNGIEAAAIISSDHDLPVVFLTGFSQEGLLDEALATEPYGCLVKPVAEESLVATIRLALARHRRDLQHRHRLGEALRQLGENRALQLSLVENIPLPVFAKDRAGRYIVCNSAYKDFFGKSDEEILGLDAYAIHPPDLAVFYSDKDEELLGTGTLQHYETKVRHRNGELRDGIVHKAVLRGEDGTVVGLVGTILDITERNRAEEENTRLQRQLLQAQKMEAIGTLAGGIAHDFNNILGAVIGYTEIIRDDSPPDSTLLHDLEQILLAANRAKDLVSQILAFSRQSEMARVPLQPARMIQETIKLLRASLPATITIVADINSATLPVLADPIQFHQLLMNLGSNACHAMEDKGGTLTIALEAVRDPSLPQGEHGYAVRLTVSDTGSGIPEEIRDRIFEPYFTTKGPGKGTGMGLAIVHGIVAAWGGSIVCESRPGMGTTFTITLPATGEAAEDAASLPDAQPPRQGREHILFVDDEATLVEITRIMLERLGYRVSAHTDGQAALDHFAGAPEAFDLAITDHSMPGMTGFELARRLLALRPDLPVILCSGYGSAVSEEMARQAGIRLLAAKPLTKNGIGALIRRVLDEGKP